MGIFFTFLLCLLNASSIRANHTLPGGDQAQPAIASHQPKAYGIEASKISAIMVGCELDRKCMQVILEELAQNNTNDLYQNLLLVLGSQQEQIDYEAAVCHTDAIQVLRKDAAHCIAAVMQKAAQVVSANASKTELSACIQQKMENWAKKGNLFAQGLLASRASKLGDINAKNYWERLIQNQVGTPGYETFMKCSRAFELIPPGLSEVAFQSLQLPKDSTSNP